MCVFAGGAGLIGQALVPYYRQILPVLNLFINKNDNMGDSIDYGQRKKMNMGELITQTLGSLVFFFISLHTYIHIYRYIHTVHTSIHSFTYIHLNIYMHHHKYIHTNPILFYFFPLHFSVPQSNLRSTAEKMPLSTSSISCPPTNPLLYIRGS